MKSVSLLMIVTGYLYNLKRQRFWIDGSDRGGSMIEGVDMPRREPLGAGVGSQEWERNS
jgi:hypothetical protein